MCLWLSVCDWGSGLGVGDATPARSIDGGEDRSMPDGVRIQTDGGPES